jgi:hypothetical protein
MHKTMKSKILTGLAIFMIVALIPGPKTNNNWWVPMMVLGYFGFSLVFYSLQSLKTYNYSQLSAYRKQVLDGKRKVYAY